MRGFTEQLDFSVIFHGHRGAGIQRSVCGGGFTGDGAYFNDRTTGQQMAINRNADQRSGGQSILGLALPVDVGPVFFAGDERAAEDRLSHGLSCFGCDREQGQLTAPRDPFLQQIGYFRR